VLLVECFTEINKQYGLGLTEVSVKPDGIRSLLSSEEWPSSNSLTEADTCLHQLCQRNAIQT